MRILQAVHHEGRGPEQLSEVIYKVGDVYARTHIVERDLRTACKLYKETL